MSLVPRKSYTRDQRVPVQGAKRSTRYSGSQYVPRAVKQYVNKVIRKDIEFKLDKRSLISFAHTAGMYYSFVDGRMARGTAPYERIGNKIKLSRLLINWHIHNDGYGGLPPDDYVDVRFTVVYSAKRAGLSAARTLIPDWLTQPVWDDQDGMYVIYDRTFALGSPNTPSAIPFVRNGKLNFDLRKYTTTYLESPPVPPMVRSGDVFLLIQSSSTVAPHPEFHIDTVLYYTDA